jgi:predicted  nucleic acid-binding Zn-ribbon protein
MAKKPPARGKLLKLKPRGKVLPFKKTTDKTSSERPAARAKAKPARKKAPPPQRMPPRLAADETEERLREAMEEVAEARSELSRLGHELTAAHRELEDRKLSSGSAEENLRAELEAVRNDLKEALAELEISRNEVARLRGKLGEDQLGNKEFMASRKPSGSSPIE